MSTTSPSRMYRKAADTQDEVDEEIRHIGDLIFIRNLLAARGATPAELRKSDAVIDRARRHLAEAAKRASARYVTAA